MDTSSAPIIPDLFSLTLTDGITLQAAGRPVIYKAVRLRETSVADERKALQLSERVVLWQGQPKLMASEADFRYAMTMRHIESLSSGENVIPQAIIDLELFGKLSSHDLGLLEARVFLIEMAAQVRYGAMAQADFDKLMAQEAPDSPQPGGQAEELGQPGADAQPGPALLADFTGRAAQGPAAGHGR